jgi:hypothetical protein
MIVCSIPEGFTSELRDRATLTLSFVDWKGKHHFIDPLDFKVSGVRLKKSTEEIKKHRRLYRQQYTSRPLVKEKIKARMNKPENIEKRRLYAKQEEVKARKKANAKLNRALRNEVKSENPLYYQQLKEQLALKMKESRDGAEEN